MQYDEDYSVLLGLFIDLVQSKAGSKISDSEGWLNDAQTLSIKLFRHLVSMQTVAGGATIAQNDVPTVFFVDHASVKVIARAALETYLVFFYIFGGSDRAVSEFRHKTWRLGGLADRQRSHASTEESREVLAREKLAFDKLRLEVAADPALAAYTAKQQKRVLDGEWKIGSGWQELAVSAGFHERYFSNIYGYLCGYSHASYISALQVGQADTIEDQKMLTQFVLGVGVVIMAHYAFTYAGLFSEAAAVLAQRTDAKRVADKWHFGPAEMSRIYGS